MERKLPGRDQLSADLAAGMTYEAMAEKYDCTRAAVYLALKRHEMIRAPQRKLDVPWKVRTDHHADHMLTMLRYAMRRRDGGTLSPARDRELTIWLERRRDLALCYGKNGTPDSPKFGFYLMQASVADAYGQTHPGFRYVRLADYLLPPKESVA